MESTPSQWEFDVLTADHDELKGGGAYVPRRSRVNVCAIAFPRWETASEIAGCMAVIRHGGMPIAILPRY